MSRKIENIENSLKLLREELVDNIKGYERLLKIIKPLKKVSKRVEKAGVEIMRFNHTDGDNKITGQSIALIIPIEIEGHRFDTKREEDSFKNICEELIKLASPDPEELKKLLDAKIEEIEDNIATKVEEEKATLASSLQSIITRNILEES
jgi:hypothetical protein